MSVLSVDSPKCTCSYSQKLEAIQKVIFSWVSVSVLQWSPRYSTLGLVLKGMVCWFISEQGSTQVVEFVENISFRLTDKNLLF